MRLYPSKNVGGARQARRKPICGVYRILHLESGAAYIGASIQVMDRLTHHRGCLRREEHRCKRLQELWNQAGEEGFIFELLEACSTKRLKELEDKYADEEPDLIFVHRNKGGWNHAESSRQKMSVALKGKRTGQKASPLTKLKLSIGQLRSYSLNPNRRVVQRELFLKLGQDHVLKAARSARAKLQHQQGKLGPQTWRKT